jgi:hypothetical protein
MVTTARTPGRDRIAIASSIALHLCVLAALVTFPRPSFPVDDPDERTLLSSIIQIQHRPTPPPPHVVVQQRPLVAVVPVENRVTPVIHAAVTVEHASRKLVVASEHRAAYAPSPTAVKHEPNPAPVTRLAMVAPKPVPAVPDAGPTTAPVASPAPSPVAAQREEGIGNFGETYPASIDPSARAPLFAGVNGVVVRITVDENGRATSIEFLRPPSDATLREELRSRLLAAHFIPAACNGLRCAGTVDLKN